MIAPSAIPMLTDALVSAWTAAVGADYVFDGFGITDDSPKTYVLVGVSDPDTETLASTATSDQTWAWLGHVQRDETGSIDCVIVSWSGDEGMKPVRDAAFAFLTSLAQAIETDPSLGLEQPAWVTGISGIDYRQMDTDNGPLAAILFKVEFRARLSAS